MNFLAPHSGLCISSPKTFPTPLIIPTLQIFLQLPPGHFLLFLHSLFPPPLTSPSPLHHTPSHPPTPTPLLPPHSFFATFFTHFLFLSFLFLPRPPPTFPSTFARSLSLHSSTFPFKLTNNRSDKNKTKNT